MAETIELIVGSQPWTFTVSADRAVTLQHAELAPPASSPRQLIREALEKPFHFEPLRRALTPDDRITIVIDPRLPHLAAMLAELLQHLSTAGVSPSAVTVVSPPDGAESWIDELPDEFADMTAETHDPADAKKLAYLATTKGGRRVYLNRSLVEADFVILLTGRRFDPYSGYAGAENALFPALSNEETRAAFAGEFTTASPKATGGEAAEIAWLLGTPFFVQVIEGARDSIQEVVAGLPESSSEGVRRQDARWRATIDREPDTVIAAVSGEPGGVSFLDLAKGLATAARVVKKGGRIAFSPPPRPILAPARRCSAGSMSQARPSRSWRTPGPKIGPQRRSGLSPPGEPVFSSPAAIPMMWQRNYLQRQYNCHRKCSGSSIPANPCCSSPMCTKRL